MLRSMKGKVAKPISLVVRKLPLGQGKKKKGRKEKDIFLKAFFLRILRAVSASALKRVCVVGKGLLRGVEVTGRKGKGREELFWSTSIKQFVLYLAFS